MSDDMIIVIVLQLFGIVSSLLTPIIIAISSFIGRIEHSECCKSKIDLSEVPKRNTKKEKKNEESYLNNDVDYDKIRMNNLRRSPNIDIP